MSRRLRGYPWPSPAISPYHPSPPVGLQGYIPCPHTAAVCRFVLVVPLLHIHVRGSTGVHRLWARPCFSSSVLRVWLSSSTFRILILTINLNLILQNWCFLIHWPESDSRIIHLQGGVFISDLWVWLNSVTVYQPIGLMSRVFAYGPGHQGAIPGWVIPNTPKMGVDA